ncbi:MAG: hypothetical protein ACC645_19580, partial [Pirellulales bacterium]
NGSLNWGGPYLSRIVDPSGLLKGTATGGVGVGGTFQWFEVINHVRAEIKQDTIVSAESALVFADNDVRNISIGVQGGAADKFGFSGVSTVIATTNKTIARIDNSAVVLTGSGQVKIPRDYDEISNDDSSLFTNVNVFGPRVEYVDDSTGTVKTTVDPDDNSITLPYLHGLSTGDSVVYASGGGVDIGGLVDRETYFVVKVSDTTIKLTMTNAEATANDPTSSIIDLNLDSTTGVTHVLFPGFNPKVAGVVDPTTNEIDLGFEHGLRPGEPVRYSNGGGTSIGGLTDSAAYSVAAGRTSTKLQLTSSAGDIIEFDLANVTGLGHSLLPLPYTKLSVEDPRDLLDSNEDGKVSIQDEHIIGISDESYLTDLSLTVIAGDESEIFNGAGGVSQGRNVGVGQALAFDLINRTTEATVNNLEVSLANGNFAPGVGVDRGGNLNLGYPHGFATEDALVYTAGSDYLISGLVDGQTYYARRTDDTTIQLARSTKEASETAETFFDPSSSVDSTRAVIDLGYAHQFQVGDPVTYSARDGVAIDNLNDGQTYYVIPISTTQIALADSVDSATDTYRTIFDPTQTVDSSSQLVFPYNHGFVQDQLVLYSNGGGTSIGGLTSGAVYKINIVDETRITLIDPSTNSPVTLDASTASGNLHTLQPGLAAQSDVVAASDRNDSRVEQIDLAYEHNFITEDPVSYDSRGLASIGGLIDGSQYYAVVFDQDSLGLAASQENAAKARERSFIPADGSTNLASGSLQDLDGDNQFETIELYVDHGYVTGDRVIYSANGGTPIGGLVDGQVYYAIIPTVGGDPSTTEIQLAASQADATAGTAIDLDVSALTSSEPFQYLRGDTLIELDPSTASTKGHFVFPDFRQAVGTTSSSGVSHSFRLSLDPFGTMTNLHGVGRPFNPQSSGIVSTTDNSINLGYAHGFSTGQAVLYTAGGDNPIGGLQEGTPYYVIVVDLTTIQFAESSGEARSNSPDVVKLDSTTTSSASHAIAAQFRPIPVVDGAVDTFRVSLHGLRTGDSVVYEKDAGQSIEPLTAG